MLRIIIVLIVLIIIFSAWYISISNKLNRAVVKIDEALSGIDAGGTLEIINTLNNLGTTVMMITQNIEDSSIFENCIRVVKEDGVSTLQS